jgi:hypothetical protein
MLIKYCWIKKNRLLLNHYQSEVMEKKDHHEEEKVDTFKKFLKENPFTTQNLVSWKPAPNVINTLFIIIFLFAISLFLGGFLLLSQNQVYILLIIKIQETFIKYDHLCNMTTSIINGVPDARYGNSCAITINFSPVIDMNPPVYMYYQLTNVFQNHRLFRISKYDYQFQGEHASYSDVYQTCYPMIQNSSLPDQDKPLNETSLYNPCGLIPYSMFNDTFSLLDSLSNTICDGPKPDGIKCDKTQITPFSVRQFRFKSPRVNSSASKQFMNPNFYYNELGHVIPSGKFSN